MNAGYSVLFDCLTTGTLCGRWPDIGLWSVLLSMKDRHGVIDVTHEYIALVTGLPIEEVIACMRRFCAPDPGSRSADHDGRRLMRLDPARSWGWRVVNHELYRERARKASKDAERVASGENRERMRRRNASRRVTRADPRQPASTRADPLSDTDTDTDKKKNTTAATAAHFDDPQWLDFKLAYPQRAGAQPWKRAVHAISARLAEGHTWGEIIDGAKRYETFCAATDRIASEYVMQAATFVGPEKHFLQPWTPPKKSNGESHAWRPSGNDDV